MSSAIKIPFRLGSSVRLTYSNSADMNGWNLRKWIQSVTICSVSEPGLGVNFLGPC